MRLGSPSVHSNKEESGLAPICDQRIRQHGRLDSMEFRVDSFDLLTPTGGTRPHPRQRQDNTTSDHSGKVVAITEWTEGAKLLTNCFPHYVLLHEERSESGRVHL